MLIILAGITLNAVIGENGIIFQSKETKNMIANETEYDNQQLAQLQNELKDNELYSGIGIIPGTDIGGGSEGGENGTWNPGTNPGGNTGSNTSQGGNNQGGSGTNTGTGDNTNTSGGDNQNQNATVRPSENQNPGGGTIVDGKTDEDPKIYVVSGDEVAASFYQSDITIQIFTLDRTKRIKYILTTTVPEISNELYPSGLVRELDIENGGTLTFTKDGEYTITAYAYDTQGNKSNPTIMWLKRKTGGSTQGGITVSVASGNEGSNQWYTSNVTLRVLGTDTGSKKIKYRVRGTATSTGQIGDKEVIGVGSFDSGEVEITNGTTFRIVADGTYSITAYSYDAGGMRLSSSEVLTLKKDATRPTVHSYTGEQIPGQGFKVKVNATDDGSKLTDNAYTYRHKESSSLSEYISSETTGNAEKMYTGLDQTKTYDMYVLVTDQAGNIAITDVIARPSLWISKATIGETVNNGVEGSRKYSREASTELTFRGQDSNNVDIMKTTYQVLGTVTKEGSIAGNSVTVGQELEDEYALNDKETRTIQLQADGNWIVKVHNYNKEGKLVTTNIVEVTRDITPPEITAFTRIARATGTANVRADVTEPCSGFSTKNDTYQYFEGTTSKSIQASNTYQYTGLTDIKTYTFKVIVKDKAGNTSEKTLSTVAGVTKDFAYTGNAQQITLDAGKYKLEVWGAQGGSHNVEGGRGGYSVGTISLNANTTIFALVGGAGGKSNGSSSLAGGFNGGGNTGTSRVSNSGGGGSDFRISSNSLYSRVIVAGGGGGGRETHNIAGNTGASHSFGGGQAGGSGSDYNHQTPGTRGGVGGSQTGGGRAGSEQNWGTYTGGSFGVGGNAGGASLGNGGGGGWYGGGASTADGGAGGGSGYVYTASTASNYPSGCLLNSSHYLSNAQTIAGSTSFPAPSGGSETGHAGNGYARITLVE